MSKKLLLADDSVVIQKLVGLSFANEDIEIISTDNGDDAISVAREIQPDIILADVVMPGKSGYEVCEAVKQDPALAQTPVLLLTGTFEAFDEDRAANAGANGQITKPFEAQALVERVTEVMNAPAITAEPVASPIIPPAVSELPITEAVPSVDPSLASGSGSGSFDESAANIGYASPQPPLNSLASEDVTPNYEASQSLENGLGEDLSIGMDTELPDLDSDLGSEADFAPAIGIDPVSEMGLDMTPNLSPNFGLEDPGAQTVSGLFDGPGNSADPAQDDGIADLDPDDGLTSILPYGQQLPVEAESPPPVSRPSAGVTFLGAADDVNETTSPNFEVPASPVADPGFTPIAPAADEHATSNVPGFAGAPQSAQPESGQFDDLTIHVPTADIDSDSHMAPAPGSVPLTGVGAPIADPSEATIVADLDQSLAFGSTSGSTSGSTNGSVDSSVDSLNLGPENVNPDDLDFAFDVSEQAPAADIVDASESMAPPTGGDSFSSLMDISESQILGGHSNEMNPPEAPVSPAETIVAGYDVSSSDLATAPGGHTPQSYSAADADAGVTPPPILPIPEPLYEIPELPRAHQAEAPSSPSSGNTNLFEDLATGSVLDEVPAAQDLEAGDPLNSNDDLLVGQPIDEDPMDVGVASYDSATHEPETSFATGIPLPSAGFAAGDIGDSSPEDDFVVGSGRDEPETTREGRDIAIPDMSPVMEQQIKETLEKVAWEAFSDLSESIVKQVMGRVEQIAWEVIPEMAETLVREEIRRMKGDDE